MWMNSNHIWLLEDYDNLWDFLMKSPRAYFSLNIAFVYLFLTIFALLLDTTVLGLLRDFFELMFGSISELSSRDWLH